MVEPLPPSSTERYPAYRRYWGYVGRPYTGCGCLYSLLIFVLIWFVLSLFINAVRFY